MWMESSTSTCKWAVYGLVAVTSLGRPGTYSSSLQYHLLQGQEELLLDPAGVTDLWRCWNTSTNMCLYTYKNFTCLLMTLSCLTWFLNLKYTYLEGETACRVQHLQASNFISKHNEPISFAHSSICAPVVLPPCATSHIRPSVMWRPISYVIFLTLYKYRPPCILPILMRHLFMTWAWSLL